MVNRFGYSIGEATTALSLEGYYVWDCSVIKAEGKYHMFSSRWKEEFGFGWNWLFNSEIIHSVADNPQGPYQFARVVLPSRGKKFFDGMNTHNTCVNYYNGKFYLYYMGTTYNGDVTNVSPVERVALEIWNRKRIGLAISDNIYGKFMRSDKPILEPRDCSNWDCTATTNPSVAILPNGKTYMIYKSRASVGSPLQLGIAVADKPNGVYRRLIDEPILNFGNDDFHIEDPFLWYDEKRKVFCLIAKDDSKNDSKGITGEWGSGFYAESKDCIDFEIAENPTVYTRRIKWQDGKESMQGNLERPSLLFDEKGNPTHVFFASGSGKEPYTFNERTYIICCPLKGDN